MRIFDERGVLVSWLIKIILVLGVLGVIVFDGASIMVNIFTLDSSANDTAIAVSLQVEPDQFGRNDQEVFDKTKAVIASDDTGAANAKVIRNGTVVDEEGNVHVKLRRVATTLVVRYIAPLKKWTVATAEGSASTN
ncbi:MAG TPA: hypothetical protein VNP73_02735 [Actinomycetota bacterium]|nr:hypothetical protein [Actinomycetota bacterium]